MNGDFSSSSLAFIEEIYLEYLKDPKSVDPAWHDYFASYPRNGLAKRESLGPTFSATSLFNPSGVLGFMGQASATTAPRSPRTETLEDTDLQFKVGMLIRNYRVRGHILADLDPLDLQKPEMPEELKPEFYGLGEADMDRIVQSGTMSGLPLREIIERLQTTYCRGIGVQFMHIDEYPVRDWLQTRMEDSLNKLGLSRTEQLRILTKLTDAVVFEDFIQKKYVGVKSFSLQGGESLIPLLDLAVEKAGAQGVDEIVFGMAHRGRLNVLTNIVGKPARQIFREFDDADAKENMGRGDVKYHLGYSRDMETSTGKKIHLSLSFNPSHLEFVNAVVMGRVRAKQDRFGDTTRKRGLGIVIHGDAAFIGEGVVQETLNMSELPGYSIGGTLHVILNNQVGFTTGVAQARSTTYASDVAKMLQSPIFHVNGEDPEAVAQVVNLAMDFREKYQRDVVIDMYCYRRFGHNETDEPAFTQPIMYEAIKRQKSVRASYLERVLALGQITKEEADTIEAKCRADLETELTTARGQDYKPLVQAYGGLWQGYAGGREKDVADVVTAIEQTSLVSLLEKLSSVPSDFNINVKVKKVLDARLDMSRGKALDWATAEALAFASLATEGHHVRMSGQDVERGTFSHRHAVLRDMKNESTYVPLEHLDANQGSVEIVNSPLSENGVLGFEYGYSLDWPDGLVLWEAQYGDFVNAAQVIVDQFISSGEDKWRRLSALTLLLPHGFEGGGPEHSSARLERFLSLCAEDNMQIMNLTTPAQYFHALRRQVKKPWRKPLVMMSPKSLLRHPKAVSDLAELAKGSFRRILGDDTVSPKKVKRILMCSGKVYYDLVNACEEQKRGDVAILRLEQLYPLSQTELSTALSPYSVDIPVVWVQEEPSNQGAWWYLLNRWTTNVEGHPFSGIYRRASASPATGSGNSHKLEQAELMAKAFDLGLT
ncbi:MAG: 2-oxoglutarate dehydrogenase E1 component [Trueperaceae bacterium]